jgi:hypothetical protein
MRVLRQILPGTTSQRFSPGINMKADEEVSRNIRLRFAFGGEKPGCDGCEDDDYEANEDAPAKVRERSAKSGSRLHEENFGIRYPFAIVPDSKRWFGDL